MKRKLLDFAKNFQQEAKVSTDPVAIDAPGGFLFEWWYVFWDIFIARTNDKHSEPGAAYNEQRNGDSRPCGQLLDPTQASMLKPCGVVGQAVGYGLLFASPDNLLVSTINGTGVVIETIYVFFFLFYAPRKDKMKIYALHSFRCSLRVYFCISSLLCGLLLLLQ